MHPAWAAAPWWVRALVAGAPAAAAAGPVVLTAGRAPMFRDEVATAQLASLSLGDLWRATEHADRVLLPYLLLMKGWLGLFGDSTIALRAPSVVAAVALVAAVAVLGGRLAGPVGGAVAGLVVAVAPLTSSLAVLARPYAVTALLAVLALLALDRALGSGRSGWWVAHAALVTASLLVQPFAVMALPAHAALAAVTPAGHRWRRVAGGWAVAGAVALLVAAGAGGQRGQVGWIAERGPAGVVRMVGGVLSPPVGVVAVVGGLVGLVLVARRRPAPWWWVGTALVLGPPVFLGLVSVLAQPAFVVRYLFLVPVGAALLVGGAAGAVADVVADRQPEGGRGWRRAASAMLLAAVLVAAVVVLPRLEVRTEGGGPVAAWSAEPPSALAAAVARSCGPVTSSSSSSGSAGAGYAAELARGWGDEAFAAALDRRAVSGEVADVARVVTSVGPPRTADPAVVPPGGAPARVVLLSLRSTAADRFVEAAAAACSSGPRLRDARLHDTRLWVVECESVPARTALSDVADHPSR